MEKKSNSASSSLVDEWINLALCEYEQIASLSNVQSLLGNTAMSLKPPSSPINNEMDVYNPNMLLVEMKHRNLNDLLISYGERIDDVRTTHSLLKSKASEISSSNNRDRANTKPQPSMEIAIKRHVELSERVIQTVMRSPHPGINNGPCGLFYENGLIRTSNEKDHENNVVALVALRASVSRLKKEFGTSGGLSEEH